MGAIAPNEFVVTNRLDERYRVGLKIRSAQESGMPPIAAFGSHAIKSLVTENLGVAPGGFFNFYVMHIGLPGIVVMLRKLESMKRFPRDLILVQLHNPHTPNWPHITRIVWDLPLHYYVLYSTLKATDRVRFSLNHLGAFLQDSLNHRIILHELIFGSVSTCVPPYGVRSINQGSSNPPPKPTSEIHSIWRTLKVHRTPERVFHNSCTRWGGFRHDGSFGQDDSPDAPPALRKDAPLTDVAVPFGGAARIKFLMSEIEKIATRNGTKIVFFAPPVYESERVTAHSAALSEAIGSVERHMTVLDHRQAYRTADYMENNSAKYFAALGQVLRELGYVTSPQ